MMKQSITTKVLPVQGWRLMAACLFAVTFCLPASAQEGKLTAGFGEKDITPDVKNKVIYMAGFGQNRKATGVHDPLKVRCIVLGDGQRKIALVSVDLVGYFLEEVNRVRKQLPEFAYVLVSSTHNHEGPDTLGIWGPNPFKSGIDPEYMRHVEKQIVECIKQADAGQIPVEATIGTTTAPELLDDGRIPIIKHDELVVLGFKKKGAKDYAGLVVQWNCHPETLGSKNTLISADFVYSTVDYLQKKYGCPIVYLTGTVGGLMTSLDVPIKDEAGNDLKDGTYEKTERYGVLLGQAADRALAKTSPIQLTPFAIQQRKIFLPLDNKVYVLGWELGVLDRPAFVWNGSMDKAEPMVGKKAGKQRLAIQTEVGRLRLGELDVAAIPGEIYPELVLDKVQDPVDPGADYPNAPIEPAIYKQMNAKYRMIIGLANDEIGYILPKRQWDQVAPFCYGRDRAQYGEVNSLGVETGPLLCEAFRSLRIE